MRHLAADGRVDLSIAVEVRIGADAQLADLRWKSARRLAENAAVLQAQLDAHATVLNIDADLASADTGEG